MEDLPEGLFRNAIDLNRFSNGTAKKLINSYNRIILKAVAELKRIEEMPSAKRPKVRAARLRALLAQTKESLRTWSVKSVNELAKDLEGIAQVQSDFATQQISQALSPSARQLLSVKSVEVTPSFANAVVNADPLDISARVLGQSLEAAVKGASGSFKLTATQGSQIRMPGGQSITKLFRGLAEKNAELFATNVQDGLLTGETTQQIARQLVGNLEFGDIGPLTKGQIRAAKLSVKEIMAKGGSLTKMANHQVMTLTRTSINQVANKASQQVYRANSDLTSKYRYVATLDSRTSPICRELDGQEFVYGKGPEPAQHFNCRSTTVAVIDYGKIQEKHPNVKPPSKPLGKRAAAGGSVPSNMTYGKWLQKQPASVKAKTLGEEKAKYFNRLAKKYGPDEAIKKFVREDGSEKTLAQLRKTYGKTSKGVAQMGLLPDIPKDKLPPSLQGNKSIIGEERPVLKTTDLKKSIINEREKTQKAGIAFMNKHAPEIKSSESILRRATFQTGQILKEINKEGVSAQRMAKLEKLFDAASERQTRANAKMIKGHAKLRKAMLKPVGIKQKQIDDLVDSIQYKKLNTKQTTMAKDATREYLQMFNGRGVAGIKGAKRTPMPKEILALKPSKAAKAAFDKYDDAHWDKIGKNFEELAKPGLTDKRRKQLIDQQKRWEADYQKKLSEHQKLYAKWDKAKEGYKNDFFAANEKDEWYKSNKEYDLQQKYPNKTVIEGTKGRASNSTEANSLTVSTNSRDDLRNSLFHEMTHTVEVQNPMLSSYAQDWQRTKAWTTKKVNQMADDFPAWRKIVDAQLDIDNRTTLRLRNGKPVFDREALGQGSLLTAVKGRKVNPQNLGEVAYVNRYMTEYMGKFYAGTSSTEVWTVAIQEFYEETGAAMNNVYRYHPDLYEMIVGLSATP